MGDFNYLHKKFGKKHIDQPTAPVEIESQKTDEDCVFVKEFQLPPVFPCDGHNKSSNPLMSFPYSMSRSYLCYKTFDYYGNNHFDNNGLNLTTNNQAIGSFNFNTSMQSSVMNIKNEPLGDLSSESSYIEDLLKYHSNMVRSFKTKARSAKDQMRRDQNTILCRIYRRRKKIENLELEYEIECLKSHYLKIMKERTRCYHYTNELLKLIQIKLFILTKFKNNSK